VPADTVALAYCDEDGLPIGSELFLTDGFPPALILVLKLLDPGFGSLIRILGTFLGSTATSRDDNESGRQFPNSA
jgi:hypothetical protein